MVDFADLKGKETVYDLGAGDARLLIATKEKHPKTTAKGFELSPPVYFLGLFRIWQSKQKVQYCMKNFFHQDVSDADCIFVSDAGRHEDLAEEIRKRAKARHKDRVTCV